MTPSPRLLVSAQTRDQLGASIEAAAAGRPLDRRALLDCLGRLEPEPRRCVLLAYQGGYSYDELSTMLKRPSGTIKSWVRRSLQRLRACLEGG